MITFTVKVLEDHKYQVIVENNGVVSQIDTTSPTTTIARELKENGFVGRRGPVRGSKRKKLELPF